jgi:hypothetical protein
MKNSPANDSSSVIWPLGGAFVGLFFFALLLSAYLTVKWSPYLTFAILSPGLWTIVLLDYFYSISIDPASLWYIVLLFLPSCMPFAFFGSLIFSQNRSLRDDGATGFVLYCIWLFTVCGYTLTWVFRN